MPAVQLSVALVATFVALFCGAGLVAGPGVTEIVNGWVLTLPNTSVALQVKTVLPIGNVDPGVIGYVAAQEGVEATVVLEALSSRSGLLGLSGLSNDMRTLCAAAMATSASLTPGRVG